MNSRCCTRVLEFACFLAIIGLFAKLATPAFAQVDLSDLSVAAPPEVNEDDLVQVSAYFTAPTTGQPARLYVSAEIAPGWHIYSITQTKATPGPIQSELKVNASKEYRVTGGFIAEDRPTVHEYKDVWPDLKVEEHEGKVTWVAPIEIAAGVDVSKLEISGALFAQACSQTCIPPTDFKFVAKLNTTAAASHPSSVEAIAAPEEYKQSGSYVTWSGILDANTIKPGGTATIRFTATPDSHWHLYALAETDPKEVSKPTLIVFDNAPGVAFGSPKASHPPIIKPSPNVEGAVDSFYEAPVTWEVPVTVNADATTGKHVIKGWIGFQTCTDKSCDVPRATQFTVDLKVEKEPARASATAVSITDTKAKYGDVAAKASQRATEETKSNDTKQIPNGSPAGSTGSGSIGFDDSALASNVKADVSFWKIVFGAFFGGMILNLMPCVFPVIGLKILSFVEQSHHDRAKLFMLNFWYSVGVVLVFVAIATVAIVLRTWIGVDFKYGSQNSVPAVAIGMAALFFVMALSLLGVWEIPIPGFLGSGKAAEISSHEGASGAIAKGVITTFLGASCSGPLVAGPFGFALDSSTPVWAVYGTFLVIGIGMATPYLILGANPSLLRFLPRPGAWMETFKHICGFVMLAAMVWVLTWLKFYYIAPTIAFLVGLWAACWWIGHVPLTASRARRLQGWGWSIAIATAAGLISFDWLLPDMQERFAQAVQSEVGKQNRELAQNLVVPANSHGSGEGSELPWQPFSKDLLIQLTKEQKTVMVDFTADWCINCKALEKAVLNTAAVKEVVLQNNVVTLVADYTESPPELTKMLTLLKAGGVPVLAIFPASNPNNPIIFRDGYTQQILIDALKQAGPSKDAAETRTASTK